MMSQENGYRNLSGSEIDRMISNGCSSEEWSRIRVLDGFDAARCKNVSFSGDIFLGLFNSSFTDGSESTTPSGIVNARLHNCKIGSDVTIIGGFLSNYIVEAEVFIVNCGKIWTEGISRFGNGIPVAVLNENGRRTVKIHDNLSAHEAYIIALYRHRVKAISVIDKMVDEYSVSISSGMGTIGRNSHIMNCSNVRNVRLGPFSNIDGALSLNEGSVNSSKEDPVYIGPGVIMKNFIVSSGSVVTESAIIDDCFIGQGCSLKKHYSAENSLFFANCEGYHGEACSVFAGPYTVTHHKSTLLIAGIFSFMNAGSGSNQSNHMYKLGPVHQGIVERGSKTASDSYLMWPARIGAFTLVSGRHYKGIDTTVLPFSYLIESNDGSILVPAINLRSVGTIRDARKWPLRDRRKDPQLLDQVNFNLLTPYTVGKIIEGRNLLHKIKLETIATDSFYSFGNIKIRDTALERGIDLYQTAIDKFLGNSIIRRLEKTNFRSNRELQQRLSPENPVGKNEWADLAGLIAPKDAVNTLLDDIESAKIDSLNGIEKAFLGMHNSYYDFEWTWASERIKDEEGKDISRLTAEDVVRIVEKWKKSVIGLDNMLYEDARKEFTDLSMTGFGIDGDDKIKKLDFEQVRGEFESDSDVAAIRDHKKQKTAIGNELIKRMKLIKE